MKLPTHIFREYDIRGLAETELDSELVKAIGQAYASVLLRGGGRRFILGHDARRHSPRIEQAFAAGAVAAGAQVLRVGQIPTPAMYFGVFTLEVDGGVVVTASHNPKEFNGFKMCLGREAMHGGQIRELAELIEARALSSGDGEVAELPGLVDSYVERLKQAGQGLEGFELVIDAGNGMASEVAPRVFRELGAVVHCLYCEADGDFPNHEADPTQEANLQDLVAELERRPGARVGIAFDGDADRIGAVDPDGRIIWGDRLLMLLAREVLSRGPATVLCDVKCSSLLEQDVSQHGGRLVMWRTGHSLIKAKMKQEGAALAGEMSGHMFFADGYYGYDDAIYAAVRLANILARGEQSISQLLSDRPERISTPELRVDCPEERKAEVVEALSEQLAKNYQTLLIDGVRFTAEDGAWGLVRASNTQSILVLRFEADSEQRLAQLQREVRSALAEQRLDPGF